jgi:hypothetical protein
MNEQDEKRLEIQIEGKKYIELASWTDQDRIKHIEFVPLDDFIRWNETH